MKKKFFTTSLCIAFVTVCMAMAIAIDVTGKWTGPLNMGDGTTMKLLYTFKVDGDKLTGTAASDEGEAVIENGKVKGSEITFSIPRNGEDVQHVGTVYADSIGMNIKSPSFEFHVTLKKEAK